MPMLRWGRDRRVRQALAVAALVLLTGGETAVAQDPGAQGGCLLSPAKLGDNAVKSFQDRPAELLALYPDGGPAMSQYVRRLAGSDVSTVPLLIALAKEAKPAHVVAIGIGLARAAAVCGRTRPELEKSIKEQVAQSGLQALISAFAVGLSSYEVTGIGVFDAPADASPIGDLLPPGGGALATGAAGPSDAAALLIVERRLLFGGGGGGVTKTFDGNVSANGVSPR